MSGLKVRANGPDSEATKDATLTTSDRFTHEYNAAKGPLE